MGTRWMTGQVMAFRSSFVSSSQRKVAFNHRVLPSLVLRHYSRHPRRSQHEQFRTILYLSGETNDDDSSQDIEPTWTYVPYDPNRANQPNSNQRPRRRPFSTWTVPKTVTIPEDQLEISFTRSSGAGGQNVNKVNTKVELKLHVMNANFIPMEVRERLSTQQSNRINKEGFLVIASQEYRTQLQNRKSAIDKLRQMILEAWSRPKVRKQRKGVSKAAKARNKEFKQRRSDKKKSRGRVDF